MPLFMKQASMVNETGFDGKRNRLRSPSKPASFFRAVLIKSKRTNLHRLALFVFY